MTNRQLLQLKRRYMAEGYKMARKKMLEESYTDDGEHYFEYEEAKEFRRRLNEIERLFEQCLEQSSNDDYFGADETYQQLFDELSDAIRYMEDN